MSLQVVGLNTGDTEDTGIFYKNPAVSDSNYWQLRWHKFEENKIDNFGCVVITLFHSTLLDFAIFLL